MKLRLILAAACAFGLLLVPSAGARTIALNWTEHTTAPDPSIVFKVRSVTVTGRKWTVRASLSNRSDKRIQVVRGTMLDTPPQYGFAILVPVPQCPRGVSCRPIANTATRASPRLPTSLAPGQTWSGTFGGIAVLPKGYLLWISMGHFLVPGGRDFSWVSQHAFRL